MRVRLVTEDGVFIEDYALIGASLPALLIRNDDTMFVPVTRDTLRRLGPNESPLRAVIRAPDAQ